MREILFRGKSLETGEWGYGDYSTLEPVYKFITNDKDVYEVDTETVGQYTGLKDKNGTKIFEGDIVKGEDEDETEKEDRTVIGNIIYKNCSFVINGEKYFYDICENDDDIEVIGNIHDNPELLEVEE